MTKRTKGQIVFLGMLEALGAEVAEFASTSLK